MRTTLSCCLAIATASCGSAVAGDPAASDADIPAVETAPPPEVSLAELVSVREVAIYQATKVTLARDGAVVTPNAPVVAGRPGLLRVFVELDPRMQGQPLVAELTIRSDGSTSSTTDRKTLRASSVDRDVASTFTFDLASEAISPATEFSVAVRAERDVRGETRYPADGFASLTAKSGAERIRIRIVPVRYDADGTGTLPDTSEATLATYRDAIFKTYPTAKVEVDVRAPLPWAKTIAGDGTGWDELIDGVMDVRAADAPPSDVYYVASFKPSGSIGKYCSSGCVMGVAPQAGPTSVSMRVAAIVGSTHSGATLAQELAHAMGRGHAPCGGPDRPDRKFPYKDGSIGVWGYDLLRKTLVDPAEYSDFMSYCEPVWVSDYTFAGLFTRIAYVNAEVKPASAIGPSEPSDTSKRIGHVGADGVVRWRGTTTATIGFYPFDNIPGGIVVDAAR